MINLMTRLRVLSIGAALSAFVYAGANATDAHVETVKSAVQSVLTADEQLEWFGEFFLGGEPLVFQLAGYLGLMATLFGGLPLATLGLMIEGQWVGVPMERRRYPNVPYWCLPFQMVSCGVSAFVVVVFIREFLLYEHPGPPDWGFLVIFPGYFGVQLILGMAAIPAWRRLLLSAPAPRVITLLP
jgi:hypothetical protein